MSFDPDEMPKWISSFWAMKKYKNVLAGINDDDCAVLKVGIEEIVISVDYLNSNPIALEFGIGSFKNIGRLLVAANISDLCGTGAKPIGFLASIMLEKKTANNEDFKLLMKGVKQELLKHDIPLVGGDTKLGNANSFCGVAVGIKERGTKLFLKNRAKVNDNIWVSGNIGSVAAAIDVLKETNSKPAIKKWAIKRIITPNVPLKKSRKISKLGTINSGTDLSDGLGADLFALCKASNVGAVVYAEKIPITSETRKIAKIKGIESWKYAFTIGGDFQFIITAKSSQKLKKYGFRKIGHICKDQKFYLKFNKRLHDLPIGGHRDANIVDFRHEVSTLLSKINIDNDK